MIHLFLGLQDPYPDLLVTSTDPALDPSILKKNHVCDWFWGIPYPQPIISYGSEDPDPHLDP
jgi:hypothetical protein